jgi:hypothetical protein
MLGNVDALFVAAIRLYESSPHSSVPGDHYQPMESKQGT